jgi:hypothetical protein
MSNEEDYETIFQATAFKVEVNFLKQSLRIQGVEYSFGLFEDIAFPVTDERFYQISKDGEMRIFKVFQVVETLENENIVITDK